MRRRVTTLALTVLFCPAGIPAQDGGVERLIARLGDPATATAAEHRLAQLGKRSVPLLVAHIERDLEDGEAGALSLAVVRVLRTIGPEAAGAVPVMIRLLKNAEGDARTQLIETLGELGPYDEESVGTVDRVLRAAVQSDYRGWMVAMQEYTAEKKKDPKPGKLERPALPRSTCIAYSRVAFDVDATVEDLLATLAENPDPTQRGCAAQALAWRGRASEEVAKGLEVALSGKHPAGVQVELAVERLHIAFSTDGTAMVRLEAAAALAKLFPQRESIVDAGMVLLRSGNARQRADAAVALGQRGREAAPTVGALIGALGTEDTVVLGECITALGMIGDGIEEAKPRLQELAEHDDPQIAARARAVLRQLERE